MTRKVMKDWQSGFSGGVNLSADANSVGLNQLQEAENARITEYGGVTKRGGTRRRHATALNAGAGGGAVYGTSWRRASDILEVVYNAGRLFTGVNGFDSATVFTDRGAVAGSGLVAFCPFRDATGEVMYVTATGSLYKCDGATVAAVSGPPVSFSYLWIYNQRLYGITGASEVLYWSALNNGDTIGVVASGGGSAVVRTFGAGRLTAGVAIGASNMLIHQRGISRFTGYTQDDIDIAAGSQGVSTGIGCEAPFTVVAREQSATFIGQNGVYELREGGIRLISAAVPRLKVPRSNYQSGNFARAAHNEAFAEMLYFVPRAGVYAHNYRTGAWSGPWTGPLFGDGTNDVLLYGLWATTDASGVSRVFVGGDDYFVRVADEGSLEDWLLDGSGGTAFTMRAKSRRFFFNDPATEKALRFVHATVDGVPSSEAYLHWNTETDSTSQFVLGTTGPVTRRIQAGGRGQTVDLTIVEPGTSTAVYSAMGVTAFDLEERGS